MPPDTSTPLSISIIIPVLNEGGVINGLLQHLRELGPHPAHQIIVVDGDPEASTLKAITVAGVTKLMARKGRGSQMNAGARQATGDCLLFLHADTRLPQQAYILIQRALSSGCYQAGAFSLSIASTRPVLALIGRMTTLRSQLSRTPYGDQAHFILRKLFESLGGYGETAFMEDVELMGRLRKQGLPICILPAMVSTSARRWEREGVIVGTLRNWMIRTLYILGKKPNELSRFYGFEPKG